jgi:hypothetical protein
MNDDLKARVHGDVRAIVQRAKTLNGRMRTLLETVASAESDDPDLVQQMRQYGFIAEFADIANGIGDLDTAVAALLARLNLE